MISNPNALDGTGMSQPPVLSAQFRIVCQSKFGKLRLKKLPIHGQIFVSKLLKLCKIGSSDETRLLSLRNRLPARPIQPSPTRDLNEISKPSQSVIETSPDQKLALSPSCVQ